MSPALSKCELFLSSAYLAFPSPKSRTGNIEKSESGSQQYPVLGYRQGPTYKYRRAEGGTERDEIHIHSGL
jgi:hypothetical protein